MVTDAFNHAPGQLLMNTGTMQFGRPSMGAWVLYGLGSETKDLPGFVVFSSGSKGPSGGDSCWGSGFLPTLYQGVQFRSGGDPVLYLSNPPGMDTRTAARFARRAEAAEHDARRGDRRSRDRHAHQLLRDGVPDAGRRAGVDGHRQGVEGDAGDVRRRAGQGVLRQQLPAGAPPGGEGRALRAVVSRGLGPALATW